MLSPLTPEMLALAWDPRRLEVWAVGGKVSDGAEQRATIKLTVSPDERYDLLLRSARCGRGWIRARVGPRSLFIRMNDYGRNLTPLIPPPGEKALTLNHGRIHAPDHLFVIDSRCLFMLTQDGAWRQCIIPESFVAYDVDFDVDGGLWIIGASPSTRIPGAKTEAAIRYQAPGSDSFELRSLRLSWLAAAKTIRYGGFEALRTVCARDDPLVATSDCAWLLDDPSSFIFLLDTRGHWTVHRLAGQSIRRILRPAPRKLLIVTVNGDVLAIGEDQVLKRVGTAASLRTALRSVCPDTLPAKVHLMVRGADVDGNNLVAAVGLYIASADGIQWFMTALCHSANSGADWMVATKTVPVNGDPELLDVAILHPGSN